MTPIAARRFIWTDKVALAAGLALIAMIGSLWLFAYVTIYQGDIKVFDTPPTAIAPNPTSRLGTMPLTFSLGVNGLPPGEYNCQVTILDPATGKANFWRAPILLVQ